VPEGTFDGGGLPYGVLGGAVVREGAVDEGRGADKPGAMPGGEDAGGGAVVVGVTPRGVHAGAMFDVEPGGQPGGNCGGGEGVCTPGSG
jgi:hypothetical protein